MAIRNLSVRIEDKVLDKLHYIADYEGRSANGQVLVLIRDCIEAFEAKHGPIVFGEEPSGGKARVPGK